MSGPPPTPTKILQMRGTARKDRCPPDEVVFESVKDFAKPPRHLNGDGKKLWRELGPQLVVAGVLQTPDLYALEQLAYQWQSFRKKARENLPIPSADAAALRAMFSEFGMTPAARRRVTAAAVKRPETNSFARFGKRTT